MLITANGSLEDLLLQVQVAIQPYGGILQQIRNALEADDMYGMRDSLVGGTDGTWAFLFEPRITKLALMYDAIRNVSNSTKSTVMAFRSEFGNLEFGKFVDGQPVRLFIDRPTAISEPFSFGQKLDGEPRLEANKVCESDLNAILDRMGFSRFRFPDAYVPSADDVQLRWKVDLLKFIVTAPPCAPGFEDHGRRFEVKQESVVPKLQLRFEPDDV